MNNDDAHFKEVSATVCVPGSKSLTQRALVAAALAQNNSFINNALIAQDSLHLIEGLRALGAQIVSAKGGFFISGTAGKIINGGKELFLGNYGAGLSGQRKICLNRRKTALRKACRCFGGSAAKHGR